MLIIACDPLKLPGFHPQGCHPPSSTQDEIPETCVALVAKVDILVNPFGEKRETDFARHQTGFADYNAIDGSNEIPILCFLHGKCETRICIIQLKNDI